MSNRTTIQERVVAHQRNIREAEAIRDPRSSMSLEELRACTVRPCSRAEAWGIISRYEWLRTMPRREDTEGYSPASEARCATGEA
jgi:hypothetical protein